VDDGLRPSAAWRLTREGDVLVLSAGADRLYALDDLDEETALEVLGGWENGDLAIETLSPRARGVAEDLIQAGALQCEGRRAEPPSVAICWVGEPDERLQSQIVSGVSVSSTLSEADGEPDMVLFVRTNGRLVETYQGAVPQVPHLLLDLAYHHTVSLGPLVLVGETACLACLAGRIGSLWGDAEPPPRPAVLESPALPAALAVRELERVASGDVRLAGATAAYDLESHSVVVGAVYRLPWCPICGDDAASPGRVDLPWTVSS
jgi:hypothetical protein